MSIHKSFAIVACSFVLFIGCSATQDEQGEANSELNSAGAAASGRSARPKVGTDDPPAVREGALSIEPLETLAAGPAAGTYSNICQQAIRVGAVVIMCVIPCNLSPSGNVAGTPAGDVAASINECKKRAKKVEEDTQSGAHGGGFGVNDVVEFGGNAFKVLVGAGVILVCTATGLCERSFAF